MERFFFTAHSPKTKKAFILMFLKKLLSVSLIIFTDLYFSFKKIKFLLIKSCYSNCFHCYLSILILITLSGFISLIEIFPNTLLISNGEIPVPGLLKTKSLIVIFLFLLINLEETILFLETFIIFLNYYS